MIAGCAATQATQKGLTVRLVTETPAAECKHLGEVIGSQGNWVTGDFTSNKSLMQGARNDLRNQAAEMGGNYVLLQDTSHSRAWGSLGTTSSTIAGQVYKCPSH
ncbi:DUF4156 domain-containing protein [Alcaligenaceae bacterium]|nr:DUF4156 domain-containing protein [Alcaligenaceae bacterium]